jgi:hypothetical protein
MLRVEDDRMGIPVNELAAIFEVSGLACSAVALLLITATEQRLCHQLVFSVFMTPEGSFCGVVVGPVIIILPLFTSIRSIQTTRSSPVWAVLA